MQSRKVHSAKVKLSATADRLHPNPCKARLVEVPEQYEHGSAKYYFTGEQGIYSITNFMELRDIDLTRSRT